jgi:hypothetical protein
MYSGTPLTAVRFGRLPVAQARSGLSRSKLYELAAENSGLFKKYGAVTIVDLELLDRVLAELPPAAIGGKTADTEQKLERAEVGSGSPGP